MFTVKIEKYPQTKLYGISALTDMRSASKDCLELWQKFMPMLKEMPGETYGISVLVEPEKGIFSYWAAAPIAPQSGMGEITLPASVCAKCAVPALKDLQAVYKYMYSDRLKNSKDWQPDYAAPCFELYDHRFKKTGEFDLYIPVKPK